MLEIALLAIASVLALAFAIVVARVANDAAGPAETRRSTRHIRDDAILAALASVIVFVAMAIGHGRSGAMIAAAWSGGACAAGALAAMGARAWRERVTASSLAAGTVGEQVVIVLALGALTALAAAAAHAFSDPQRLAPQLPEMVVAFAVGCAVLDMGERALPSAAAMVLASYFFDSNAGVLRSAPSYASALGLVLFPLAATALGALGAAVAIFVHRAENEASARRSQVASVLALPAGIAASIALLGWLWEPFALCAAVGATVTLVPKLAKRDSRAAEGIALAALAGGALVSYAIAKHTGLVHAGPLGLAVAAISAESAALVDRGSETDGHAEVLSDRQAAALAAIAVALAVLDGAALVRCTRFAEMSHAPTDDTGSMLAHCTIANVAPAHIDLAHPVVVVAALAALAACVLVRADVSLRSRAVTMAATVFGVVAFSAAAHFTFGMGLESIAAASLSSSMGAALFPASCSRNVAAMIASSALALGAVVG